jgi:hypothetical protein
MYYPKECFSINLAATKNAKKAYRDEQNKMYSWIEKNYPNYYSMTLREHIAIIKEYKRIKN